jgi:protein tyrosine phosphatase
MLNLARKKLYESISDNIEYIIIHCSAGCGRTGTLITIDYCWNLLKNNEIKIDFNLTELVKLLRGQRMSMVETIVS